MQRPCEIAQTLAERLGVRPGDRPDRVRLSQRGRMRRDADSPWMSFHARQTIFVRECAFDWRARCGPAGLIGVRDALIDGAGLLQVTALGIWPLLRIERSAELTRGEKLRYLAELPWAPHAIVLNPSLTWREAAPGRLAIEAADGDAPAQVVCDLDEHGRIVGGFARDRPRAIGKAFTPTMWRGRYGDYIRVDGLWLPHRAEVGWEIDGTYAPVWQGRIEDWRTATLR